MLILLVTIPLVCRLGDYTCPPFFSCSSLCASSLELGVYCLFDLNKILDLWMAISQWKTMLIKNQAILLHKKIDSLCSSVNGFFVGINLLVVNHDQRSFSRQNLAKLRLNCICGFTKQNWEKWLTWTLFHSMHNKHTRLVYFFQEKCFIRLAQINPARSDQSLNSRVNSEDGRKSRLLKKRSLLS